MVKKTIIMVLCIMLAIPCAAFAEDAPPDRLEAPKSFNVRESDHPATLYLRFVNPQSVTELMDNEVYIHYELDWKVNNGPWKFDKNWVTATDEGLWEYYDEYPGILGGVNNIFHDEDDALTVFVNSHLLGMEYFDLQNNTFYFRLRYNHEYEPSDSNSQSGGRYEHIVSPYVEASIGKLGTSTLPASLEAPVNLTGELKQYPNGQPYFRFIWQVPDSVSAANRLTDVKSWMDWKIGDGKWASESGEMMVSNNTLEYSMDIDPVDKGSWGEINIEKNTYHFRGFFEFERPDGTPVRSPFSNVVSIGTAHYQGASSWAVSELDKAVEYGLITERIRDNIGSFITREEFAELATRLYEVYTREIAETAPVSTFTDTVNPEVFKAYKLGIVNGVGDNKFDPYALTTREQIAAMLNRVVRVIKPEADLSVEDAPSFADQHEIESYFVDNVRFMAKNGLITGIGNNRFAPKDTCTREVAVLIAVRLYEAYK